MMKENLCTFAGKRDEVLIAYLYDEIDGEDRAVFDRHLATCAPCRTELAALGGVRSELGEWNPPSPVGHVEFAWTMPSRRPRALTLLREIPVWAQVAAAVLVLGVSASLANLEVAYGSNGVSVTTGWRHRASANATAVAPASTPLAVTNPSTNTTPWHDDLATLERELRVALAARSTSAAAVPVNPVNGEALLHRVRALIQESERRQQSELALRIAEIARDMQAQRQADFVKIDRTLGEMQNRTGLEVMRTQRQVNSLAQRVSQRQ